MGQTQFTDRSGEVIAKVSEFTDLLMGTMAAQIEIQIKTSGNTPIKQGHLRASARSIKIADKHYQVVDTAGYAAAQEAGQMTVHEQRVVTPDNGATFFTLKPGIYQFKNHPRGGGAGYFRKAIDIVKGRASQYIKSSQDSVGL